MNIQNIKDRIRTIPDFPSPGIQFKDITPLLPHVFQDLGDLPRRAENFEGF